jgi:Xaa-Pro dipeptidase
VTLVLIDLWAKQPGRGGGLCGHHLDRRSSAATVPARHQDIFQIVRRAQGCGRHLRARVVCGPGRSPMGGKWTMSAARWCQRRGVRAVFPPPNRPFHRRGGAWQRREYRQLWRRRMRAGCCLAPASPSSPGIYLRQGFRNPKRTRCLSLSAHDAVVYGQPVQAELVPIFPAARSTSLCHSRSRVGSGPSAFLDTLCIGQLSWECRIWPKRACCAHDRLLSAEEGYRTCLALWDFPN